MIILTTYIAFTSNRIRSYVTVGFILGCLALFLLLGRAPVTLLVFAGGFDGLILPVGFTVVLSAAWRRRDLLQGCAYPRWLLGIGVAAWALTLRLGHLSLSGLRALWAR